MQQGLGLGLEAGGREVRVGIAAQQQRLEKQHAGGPNVRAAAEPRQDELGDQRLERGFRMVHEHHPDGADDPARARRDFIARRWK